MPRVFDLEGKMAYLRILVPFGSAVVGRRHVSLSGLASEWPIERIDQEMRSDQVIFGAERHGCL